MFKNKKNKDSDLDQNIKAPGITRNKWVRISFYANVVFIVFVIIAGTSATLLHQSDTNPNFCGVCHNMQDHVDSYLNSNKLDNIHYQANVQCKECHFEYTVPDEILSGIKFVTGDYDKNMPKRKYSDDMCLECHISMEYHANRTDFLEKNPHFSHWPDLKCTTCHLSHEEQVNYCDDCHDDGGQRMTGGKIIPRADNPWDKSRH